MKKLLAATALALCFGVAQPAMAKAIGFGDTEQDVKNMTPEQKQSYREQKKAEFEKLSKPEKLKLIEAKRQERLKRMDEKWKSMSDDDKIKMVEERMDRHGGGQHDGM